MCIIGLLISFVTVIGFVCFNNNIFLWRRFARSLLKILFVFLFPDSFQPPVDVSIRCFYYIGIWVIWYACKHPNLPILRYLVILVSARIIFDEIFYYFIFRFNLVFRKWTCFSRFAIIILSTNDWCSSWLYRFIFCPIDVLSKTSKVSQNSVASGSVSLDMKESIWSGTLLKLFSRFAFFFHLLKYSLLFQ